MRRLRRALHRMSVPVALVGLLIFGLSAPATAAATSGRPLAERFKSHRVLYDMTLGQAGRGSNVTDAAGTMYYSFLAACDGWEVETRVILRIRYEGIGEEVDVVDTTWFFKSFESFDGTDFRFEVEHNRDGDPIEILAGDAHMAGGRGIARFGEPARASFDLPNGTLFPTRHMAALIDAATANEAWLNRLVFDGASINNPYEVNGFLIGRLTDPAKGAHADSRTDVKPAAASGKALRLVPARRATLAAMTPLDEAALPVWRMRLGFFPTVAQSPAPEFEIEVDYREDGVAERMVQDFGNFTLDLKPSRFEPLPRPACVAK